MEEERKTIISKILMIVIIGFFLNLLYEVSHSMLYDWDKEPLVNDIYVYIPRIILYATCFDALWIFTFILLNSLFQKGFNWLKDPQRNDYIVFIILGLICAILIELSAILWNSWSYNEYMPEIFGLGLTPLIQLALTSIISLYLSAKLKWTE